MCVQEKILGHGIEEKFRTQGKFFRTKYEKEKEEKISKVQVTEYEKVSISESVE